jgi:hypothetical protein
LVALDIFDEGLTYVYEMIRKIAEQSSQTIRWRGGTAFRVLNDPPTARAGEQHMRCIERQTAAQVLPDHLARPARIQERRRRWEQFSRALNSMLRSR